MYTPRDAFGDAFRAQEKMHPLVLRMVFASGDPNPESD
jgi:hypothetical protein